MGFKTKQDIRDHIYSKIETDYVVDTNLPPKEVMPRLRKNYYNRDVKELLVLRNGYTKLFVYYIENPDKKYIILKNTGSKKEILKKGVSLDEAISTLKKQTK